jgi:hypothetical protein
MCTPLKKPNKYGAWPSLATVCLPCKVKAKTSGELSRTLGVKARACLWHELEAKILFEGTSFIQETKALLR